MSTPNTFATMNTYAQNQIIADAYPTYRNPVTIYLKKRLPHPEEAEDLCQDVFLKLLESLMLVSQETISSLIFTIAKNLVIDNIRRHHLRIDIERLLIENTNNLLNTTENEVNFAELERNESIILRLLSTTKKQSTACLCTKDSPTKKLPRTPN